MPGNDIPLHLHEAHVLYILLFDTNKDTDGLSTPIFFHRTEFQLPDLLPHRIRKGATLAHFLNYHSTDLLISAEGSFDSVLPQRTQHIDFILTDVNQDDTTRAMVLMGFELDVALQGTILQQPLLGSKHTACKIAVVGS
jgi:hypothetical protein